MRIRKNSLKFNSDVQNDPQEDVIKYFLTKSLNNATFFYEVGVKLGL